MLCRNLIVAVCLTLLVIGCDQRSAYDRIVARELATGARFDTLFLSYALGMSKQAFYDSSWALNRRGLVMQGPQNQNVQYKLPEALPYPATMLFYPDFSADRIYQMRVRFGYDDWAPWAKRLSSDSLQLDVLALLERWYGKGFFEHGSTVTAFGPQRQFVKVDGNRRILVMKYSDTEVLAMITDLLAEKAMIEERDADR